MKQQFKLRAPSGHFKRFLSKRARGDVKKEFEVLKLNLIIQHNVNNEIYLVRYIDE